MTSTTRRRGHQRSRPAEETVLRIVSSPHSDLRGSTVPLNGDSYTFGRGVGCEISVQDGRMSRLHARLFPSSDGGYRLEDLGTTNGTFLDGRRVVAPTPLEGSVVSMGDTLLVVDRPPDPDWMPIAKDADPNTVRSIFGWSFATQALRRSVATVGPKPGPVLLLGATGVGKEVTARAVHEASGRSGRFLAVNCAAIPENLAESAFFGHYKHAFTGADADQPGHFRTAHKGTLFLDEVGDMPPSLQAKLLRVLEDGVVQPVGYGPSVEVDVRIVAATNADLEATDFRTDLLARLNQFEIRIPPLAARKADILELWRMFCMRELGGAPPPSATPEFNEALLLHAWPYNVRELRQLVGRTVGLAGSGGELMLHSLPRAMRAPILPRFEEGSGAQAPAPTPEASAEPHPDADDPQPAGDPPTEPAIRREAAPSALPPTESIPSPLADSALDLPTTETEMPAADAPSGETESGETESGETKSGETGSRETEPPSRPPPEGREELVAEVADHQGNIKALSDATGWHRTQIYRWLKRWRIEPNDYR